MAVHHIPVLLREVLAGLQLQPGDLAVDATLGGGGHTAHMLQAVAPTGKVLGLDADPQAITRVSEKFQTEIAEKRFYPVHAHFEDLGQVAKQNHFEDAAGILLDLGVSSFQLDEANRGFSFQHEGPLDMRMDPTQGISAADIVNQWDEEELADIIYIYGEDRLSRRLARLIVKNRPYQTTRQLAEVIEKQIGRRGERIHPATRTFQALRIVVNRELEQIETVLPQALNLLRAGGRIAVISFHSLEDRIVKRWMQGEASDFVADPANPFGGVAREPTIKIITRKPLEATTEEIQDNPRSRSAKLRIAEKL
ncbi:MAG: 16S rRNA (cytosine(1402)-N(4))-methyltransferase RsmH [Caldilineaceae bacterium]